MAVTPLQMTRFSSLERRLLELRVSRDPTVRGRRATGLTGIACKPRHALDRVAAFNERCRLDALITASQNSIQRCEASRFMAIFGYELLVQRTIDMLYDAAVGQDEWSATLRKLAELFNAGFADLCSWTHDRQHVSGLVHGLDSDDYNDALLGFWFNRNVWGRRVPARIPGEVLSTRSMVPREDLRRSEMYRAYLEPRGLHEGLRLTLWADEVGLGDLSLLRPWSAGAFGPAEVELGQVIVPHLQRATTITRRLRAADFRLDLAEGGAAMGDIAAVAFDRTGRPFWLNPVARKMVELGTPLRLASGRISASTPAATAALAAAVARAAAGRQGGAVMLPRPDGLGSINVVVVALAHRDDWSFPVPPAAMIYLRVPDVAGSDLEALRSLFGLTAAEGELARDLRSGATIAEIAARTGRSQNTLRTHLARLMQKSGTNRQVDLVRLLDGTSMFGVGSAPEKQAGDPLGPAPRRVPTSREIRTGAARSLGSAHHGNETGAVRPV